MILVAGISASGKTHTLARLADLTKDWPVVSASGLLSDAGSPLRPLTADQAYANQRVLLQEIRDKRIDLMPNVLLDGHALVETIDGMIPVPDEWYDALDFTGFVHVEAGGADIAARRGARGLPWTPDDALREQRIERDAVHRQAHRLNVPVLDLPAGDLDGLMAWLDPIRRPVSSVGNR